MIGIVTPGAVPQIAMINELKNRGIHTILADMNPKAIARPFADEFYEVSAMDPDALVELAKKTKADFIVTCCADQVVLSVAEASEKLGLPCYIDYETAKKVSNKESMKRICDEFGVPTAHYVVMTVFDRDKIKHLRYPLIVKPVDAYSSRGVKKCLNEEEVIAAFENAVNMSKTDSAIVEEYNEGFEISVDGWVEDGKANILTISVSDKIQDKDSFVIFRTKNPAPVSDSVWKKVEDVAQRLADGIGLANTPLHIQLITDNQNVSVLEFCARTGGSTKWEMIKRAAQFDVVKGIADLTLGIKPHYEKKERVAPFCMTDFLYCKEGVFDHVEGFEELKQTGDINDYFVFRLPGGKTTPVRSSGDRVAAYFIHALTIDELLQKHEIIRSHVKILDPEGNDILRHDLITVPNWYDKGTEINKVGV